jgi:hypothetical protein
VADVTTVAPAACPSAARSMSTRARPSRPLSPRTPGEGGLESTVALAPQRERLVLDHAPELWDELVLAGGRRVRQEDL